MILFAQSPTSAFHLHTVRIDRIDDLSPSFRRFTLTGDRLDSFADNGFDQRIKLILPLEEHGLSTMPMTDDWYALWRELPDQHRNPIRTYTVRDVRAELREIDVDVVVHPVDGPASIWAETAAIGDELIVLGPNALHEGVHGGVDFLPPPHAERILLAGDETALPAIASILERLPATASGHAIVEVPHADDAVCVPSHPGFTVEVLARHGLPQGELLVPSVQAAAPGLLRSGRAGSTGQTELGDVDVDVDMLWEVPSDDHGGPAQQAAPLYAWLAGEAGVIKTLRRHLVSELGIDRKSVAFMGYWRLGRAEG
ncbi:NADPH-dependent ferric siderophore reductase, contains FAD-binding and SIP domains [Agreia bicolorata]|uniref:NADPH-dependent ferric siderophore reductase, contains FAD-binding and SIP domains n=1 Tax=Agreia bicolorata TaxID=110935 RepID=A0A1T4YI30_9MICO|nr:NADPH-dependent ferric siderophore reductase, contains FAD-binding and SIP domains [Agreia bicolorata]